MDIALERILSLLPHKPDGKIVQGAKKQFLEKVGISSPALLSDWIAGRSTTYTSYVYQIASKYNVNPDWLLGKTDEKSPAPVATESNEDGAISELMKIWNEASESEREELLAIARYVRSKRG